MLGAAPLVRLISLELTLAAQAPRPQVGSPGRRPGGAGGTGRSSRSACRLHPARGRVPSGRREWPWCKR